jgi:hypothetical protein
MWVRPLRHEFEHHIVAEAVSVASHIYKTNCRCEERSREMVVAPPERRHWQISPKIAPVTCRLLPFKTVVRRLNVDYRDYLEAAILW